MNMKTPVQVVLGEVVHQLHDRLEGGGAQGVGAYLYRWYLAK